ncbi:MAG: hypothetical protein ACLGI5_03410 [Thermoleophilia bacterium]
MSAAPLIGRPAQELLARKHLREGWLLVLAGVLIPFFGIWAAAKGVRVWGISRSPAAIVLIVVGVAVFAARLTFYVMS